MLFKRYLQTKDKIFIVKCLTIILYFIIQFGLKSLFSSTAGADAGTIEKLAEMGEVGGGSYGMTAFLYSIIPSFLQQIVVYLTGYLFISYCFSHVKTFNEALIISFLCFAPIMMAIGTFQKDLVLVWFLLPLAYFIGKSKNIISIIFFLVFVYVLYSSLFRIYFYLILLVSLYVFFLVTSPSYIKIFLLIVLVISLAVIPDSLLYELQSPRDIANFNRIYAFNRDVTRTAFMNPFEIDGLLSFFYNYIYSFWMMDFSLLHSLSIKEMYLSFNLFLYYYFAYLGVTSSLFKSKILGSLIISHILVLHIFEPDSGSYLRHLSSVLPFLSLLIFYESSRVLFIKKLIRGLHG